MEISRNTSKIMDFLLRHSRLYNINQLARKLNISVGSVHKIVKALESRKLVLVTELGNARYYSLNFRNTEAVKLCELLLIQQRRMLLQQNRKAKVYASDLEKSNIPAVVLFGSLLVHPEQAKDVDVLFLIRRKQEVKQINAFCLEISRLRTKKISPLIMLIADFGSNLTRKDKVIEDIVEKGIVLKGEDIFIRGIIHARPEKI